MSDYLIDNYVNVKPGQPYRLFPFGKLVKSGKERDITPELASKFRLPHFKPPIKLGSHNDATPAGGHIVGLEVREDGLYAIPEINDEGGQALDKGAYRYHSPEIIWEDGYLEDPTSGGKIQGPLIVGDALLHTPHLGEAAALYSIDERRNDKVSETVQVPTSTWDKIMSWLEPKDKPQPEPERQEQPEVDKFAAVQKERDDLAAKLQAIEDERAHSARVDKFGAELKETKVGVGAEMLAGMTDEQAAWVVQQFKALSAQIDESALTSEKGSDGEGVTDPKEALQVELTAIMEADKVDYSAAFAKVQRTKPELINAAYPRKEGK